jgi:hypothetical protein
VQQQVSTSINNSNTFDAATSLLSILPSATDIATNPEDEQLLRKPKKKKKGRRIGECPLFHLANKGIFQE